MKFKKEFLQNVVYGDEPKVEMIEDTIIETSRWSILHKMIFSYDGKYYTICFQKGATEMQEEQPFEYDGDDNGEIECVEVVQVERIVKVWEPVE